ncbi:unnamed protein product, partial [Discosporangium mesarthrocarpum]
MKPAGSSTSGRPERFHGAFTGGFSAGFFNTVGTAEGWTPSSYTSSRDKRAPLREQRPEDFMDKEDGLLTEQLQAKQEFDTLGTTASEIANKYATHEARGSAIPGPAPSELVVPIGDPMGKKLLRTMGWREGQGVGSRVMRRKGRKRGGMSGEVDGEDIPEAAWLGLGERPKKIMTEEGMLTFAPENKTVVLSQMEGNDNLYGVGHNPFANAPEFDQARIARASTETRRAVYRTGDLLEKKGGRFGADDDEVGGARKAEAFGVAPESRGSHGFAVDDGEDDVYEGTGTQEAYHTSLDPGDGQGASARLNLEAAKAWASEEGESNVSEAASVLRKYARCPADGRLPPAGFVVAHHPDFERKHWQPPLPPADFDPVHKFQDEGWQALPQQAQVWSGGKPDHVGHLSARGRSEALGEPVRQGSSSEASSVPKAAAPFTADSSVFDLVSEAGKQQIGAASKHGSGASAGDVMCPRLASAQSAAANIDGIRAAMSDRFAAEGQLDMQRKAVLASRFTSSSTRASGVEERKESTGVGDAIPVRPAGLSVSISSGISKRTNDTMATVTAPAESRGGVNADRKPVRVSVQWLPVPLLCKRLNIPVPAASREVDWESPAGTGGQVSKAGAMGLGTVQDFGGLKQGFAGLNPRPSQRQKVALLEHVEAGQPVRFDAAAGASSTSPADLDPGETRADTKPPIDLFKSIFEAESDSDFGSDSERDNTEVDQDKAASQGHPAQVIGEEKGGTGTETQNAAEKRASGEVLLPQDPQQRGSFLQGHTRSSLHQGYGSESSEESCESKVDREDMMGSDPPKHKFSVVTGSFGEDKRKDERRKHSSRKNLKKSRRREGR